MRDDVSAEAKSQGRTMRTIMMNRELWRTLFAALLFDIVLRAMPDLLLAFHKWTQRF